MKSGIYKITNTVNGKVYIGSAVNLVSRFATHKSGLNKGTHRNKHLQHAWDKYGADAFTFYILEECSREKLLEREQFYLDTTPEKYNLSAIAGIPMLGRNHSLETKELMSAKSHNKGKPSPHRGVPRPPEVIEKVIAANVGKPKSPEHRAAISAALKGRKMSPWTVAKRVATITGKARKPFSSEHKAKLSAAAKIRTYSLERREKMSESMKLLYQRKRELKALQSQTQTGDCSSGTELH